MPDSTPTPDEPEVVDAEVVDPTGGRAGILPAVPPPAPPPADYDEHGVPTFDHVRDKIEGRYATSLGATELSRDTEAARTLEQQEAERADKARAKLEEIRRSLGR
jgi:hypothetical protein